MVAITIIGILAIWVSKINFNNISWKQKLEIFTNKVVSNFETIRNNSLLWKWMWTDLKIPEEWQIEIWTSWITIKYTNDWNSWPDYNELSLPLEEYYEILNMRCLNINWDNVESNPWTWTINIKWNTLSFPWNDWCAKDKSSKIFQFTIRYKNNFEKTLKINILNWLIEEV